MAYNYSYQQFNKEKMARVAGISLPISTKMSIEVCRVLRKKTTTRAKTILKNAIDIKEAIPFKRFVGDLGHKRKMGPGRYPVMVASEILKLIEAVEANAQFKGLNTANLVICHIKVNMASRPWHNGRKSRRKMKRTTVEIVVEEKAHEKKEAKHTKQPKKDQK